MVGADVPGGPRPRGRSRARGDVVSLFYSVFLSFMPSAGELSGISLYAERIEIRYNTRT